MQNTTRKSALFDGPLRIALGASLIVLPVCIGAPAIAAAQDAAQNTEGSAAATVIPQQVRYAGKLAARTGETVEAEFRIYAAAEGGDPLWTETQRVAIGEDGSYSVLLGSANPSGLPQAVFAGGAARWLGVSVDRTAESERVLLSSVPYAMKSADAESLSGHAASDFVTQEQLAQLAAHSEQPSTTAPAAQPNGSGPLSGLGTMGTVPLWAGANALGNSLITQLGSNIGINLAAPSATLDVAGSATIRGTLSVGPVAPATAAGGQNSQHLNLTADAWSTATNSALAQTFDWVAAAVGNNTASPSGALYLQFQSGTAPRTNLFDIDSTGVFHWAPSQTFPGTIGSVTATSPVTATTTSSAVSLGLNTSALVADIASPIATAITPSLETTFNGVYAQLGTSNNFSSYIAAHQTEGDTLAAIFGEGTNGSTGVSGSSDTAYGVYGQTASGKGVFGKVTSPSAGSIGVLGSVGTTFSATFTGDYGASNAGVWADASNSATSTPIALFATADSGYSGVFVNNTFTYPTIEVINQSGIGITSNDDVPALQQGAIMGTDGSSHSATFNEFYLSGGLMGDSSVASNTSLFTAGIVGTGDDNFAGLFYNHSATRPTIYADNLGTGSTGLFTTIKAVSAKGACGVGGNGDLTCTGQVKTLSSTGSGAHTVETYAMQSPENWMEDFGSGNLQQGVAVVTIDPAFAETVSETSEYHVFLTPKGDSKGLYVINETAGSFEVRESGGGTSSLAFDYRIVAKRRGYESQRLTDVTERFKAESKSTIPSKFFTAP